METISGKTPYPHEMAYWAVKANVIHFTRLLARELAEHNINVNCICPGEIYTPLWEKIAAQSTRLLPEAKGVTPREYFLKFVVSRVLRKRR